MATQTQIDLLTEALESITAFGEKKLISRPDWGLINFDKAKSDIDLVLSIAADLSELPLQFLTDHAASLISRNIPAVAGELDKIEEFDIEASNPSGPRDQITNDLHTAVEALQTQAGPWILYLAYKRGDVSENIAQLSNAVSEAQNILSKAETWIEVV